MLQQVVSEFEPMLAEEQLTCTLDLPPRMDYPCDPDKLARVFDNLLRNACHYSTPGDGGSDLRSGDRRIYRSQLP